MNGGDAVGVLWVFSHLFCLFFLFLTVLAALSLDQGSVPLLTSSPFHVLGCGDHRP